MEAAFSLLIAGFAVWFLAELMAKLEAKYPNDRQGTRKYPISVKLKFLGFVVLFLLIQLYVVTKVWSLKDFTGGNFVNIVIFAITVVYFWIPMYHYHRVLNRLKKEQEKTQDFN